MALIAWSLQDGIETVRWLRGVRGPSPALDAARQAALAVLLRADLGERRFRALYKPFDAAMSATDPAQSLRNLCAPERSATSTFDGRLALRT